MSFLDTLKRLVNKGAEETQQHVINPVGSFLRQNAFPLASRTASMITNNPVFSKLPSISQLYNPQVRSDIYDNIAPGLSNIIESYNRTQDAIKQSQNRIISSSPTLSRLSSLGNNLYNYSPQGISANLIKNMGKSIAQGTAGELKALSLRQTGKKNFTPSTQLEKFMYGGEPIVSPEYNTTSSLLQRAGFSPEIAGLLSTGLIVGDIASNILPGGSKAIKIAAEDKTIMAKFIDAIRLGDKYSQQLADDVDRITKTYKIKNINSLEGLANKFDDMLQRSAEYKRQFIRNEQGNRYAGSKTVREVVPGQYGRTAEIKTTTPINKLLSREGAPDRNQVIFYKNKIINGEPVEPIRIVKEGNVWGIEDGKHRYQAYKELGYKEVPTIDVTKKISTNIKPKPTKLLGAGAGIETYQDENGQTRIRYNPIKGGIGLVAGNIVGKKINSSNDILKTLTKKSKNVDEFISNVNKTGLVKKTDEELKTIFNSIKGKVPDELKSITNKDLNLKNFNVSDESKNTINKLVDEARPTFEKKMGEKLSNKEVIELSQKTGKMLNSAVGRESTKKWEAQLLRLRQQIAADAEAGVTTSETIKNIATLKEIGADIARKLQSFSIGADPKDLTLKEKILDAITSVTKDFEKISKEAEGIDFNDARQAVAFYRKFIKPKASEWIDLLRYNSMLTSPLTHIKNIFSNLLGSGIIAPIEKTLSGTFDFLGHMKSGDRKMFAGEGLQYSKGYLQNIGNAFREFTDIIKGKKLPSNQDIEYMPLAQGGVKGLGYNLLAVPLKVLEGMDQFFMALGRGGEEAALKYRMKKGVDVKDLITRIENSSKERVFRKDLFEENQGHLENLIDEFTSKIFDLRNSKNPFMSTIAKFTVPFVKTPMNIFKQGLEYNPLTGPLTMIGAKNKTELLARSVIGGSIMASAAALLGTNRLSWSEPTNAEDKNAFRAAGRQPYSIKVGDKWYSYQYLGPYAFPIALVSAVDNGLKEKKIDESTAQSILSSVAKFGTFLSDMSYMKSIGDFVDAVQGGEYAIEKWVGNIPQQMIPYKSLMGWITRLGDTTQRTIDNKAGFIDKQVQLMMMNIPGLSNKLPARTDAYGKPIEQQSPLLNALSPIKVSTENPQQSQAYDIMQQLRKAKTMQTQENAKLKEQYLAGDQSAGAKLPSATLTSLTTKSNLDKAKQGQSPLMQKLIDTPTNQLYALKESNPEIASEIDKAISIRAAAKPKKKSTKKAKSFKAKKLKIKKFKAKKLKLKKIKVPKGKKVSPLVSFLKKAKNN